MRDALEDIVINELAPLGLELFELRTGGSKGRTLLDVRVDRKDGEKVTLDDCARASRAIEARLDSMQYAGTRYVLEVSSPGLERPLHFALSYDEEVGCIGARRLIADVLRTGLTRKSLPEGTEILVDGGYLAR